MKKDYQTPKIEIIDLSSDITASAGSGMDIDDIFEFFSTDL